MILLQRKWIYIQYSYQTMHGNTCHILCAFACFSVINNCCLLTVIEMKIGAVTFFSEHVPGLLFLVHVHVLVALSFMPCHG